MEWVLIIVFAVGLSGGDKAITSQQISGFATEKSCSDAGMKTSGMAPSIKFVCIEKPKGGK